MLLSGKAIGDLRRAVDQGRSKQTIGTVDIAPAQEIVDITLYHTWSLVVPTVPFIHNETCVGLWHLDEEI